MYVFIYIHGCTYIKVFDIGRGVSGTLGGDSGDGGVKVAFDCGETGSGGGKVAVIYHAIATKCEAYSFGFCSFWSGCNHCPTVSCCFSICI